MEKMTFGSEMICWQEAQSDGFSGIVTDPKGRRGFVSKAGGAFSFYEIGKGQDAIEVMRIAKALHEALTSEGRVDPNYLKWLGEQAQELAAPKTP
jgi:hypothetical protein